MPNLRKTRKMRSTRLNMLNGKSSNYSVENIIITFMQMSNTVKLFHWKTKCYAEHKASDELHSKLGDGIDKFVEVLLGKMNGHRFNINQFTTVYDDNIKTDIDMFKKYLVGLSNSQLNNQTDLMNIRDEILGHCDQFLYLLTLK